MTVGDPYTRPSADSAALVLIDVRHDFLDIPDDTPGDHAAMPVHGTRAAISAMAQLTKAFRERGLPIVHVIRLYQPDGSNADLVRRRLIEQGARIAAPGSTGSQIAAELLPNVVELEHELLLSGCVRSIQYLSLNAVSYADVPPPLLSKSTSVGGVAQQLARGFGVAVGAALLAVIAGPARVTVGDFQLALFLIALIPLFSALGFLRLSPVDGAEVSGHRRVQPRSA